MPQSRRLNALLATTAYCASPLLDVGGQQAFSHIDARAGGNGWIG